MQAVFLICALISIAAVLLICYFVFVNGFPAFHQVGPKNFLFGRTWNPDANQYGIFPMMVGSLYVTAGAIVVGVPIGIFSAVYLSYYASKRIHSVVEPAVQLLAGIPSIVYGFFGLVVIVPVLQSLNHNSGKGILTASILLGLMILPTIISTTESALNAVPGMYFEGSLAMGATKERSIFRACFPAARSGILSGVILGIGRAIGETMAVIMVCGNQAIMPESITSGVRTLTSNIVLEMGYASGLHREALITTSAVLFVFILIINLCFSAMNRKKVSE